MKINASKFLLARQLIALVVFVFIGLSSKGQTLPVADFTYSVGTNGTVNFTSTSTNTISTLVHKWYFGDGSSITGPQITSHTYSANGYYLVILAITNSLGVIYDSTTKAVSIAQIVSSIPSENADQLLQCEVYPNPSSQLLHVVSKSNTLQYCSVVLLDAMGRNCTVAFWQTEHELMIDVSALSIGYYNLLLRHSETGSVFQKRFIVAHPTN